jgi:hypothetical protein
MAIDLSALFGQQPDYSQFISPAEQQRMQSNAGQQALLNAAIAALSMTGQTRQPISTGQVLAGALGAGSEGYNQAFDRTLKQMVTGMQLEDFKRKQRARELASQAFTRTPQQIPMATSQGSQLEMLSRPEFGGDMAAPETVAALRANLPTKLTIDENKLVEAAALESPIEALKLVSKEDKAPSSVKEYEFAVRDGFKGTYTDFLARKTPSTNISVDTGKGLAQIAPVLKDAQAQAQGSVLQIDAADRVISAVDTNKVIAGTMATPRMRLAQLGSTLGVTGRDTEETIANTRQAIRGFAELTLQGRKSMRGEGQITEAEGKLAERAFSGDIDSLTPAEIKQIANASKRVAQYTVGEYNRRLDILGKNPEMSSIVDFYRISPIAPMPKAGGVKRFNPATGKVE